MKEAVKKSEAYKALVQDVIEDHTANPRCNRHITLSWCPDCKEINLWTYWQGLGYAEAVPQIDILLVGQDWGNPSKYEKTIDNIRKLNNMRKENYNEVLYFSGTDVRKFDTDKNLIALFEHIGYSKIDTIRYPNLFFTNFCLGYIYAGTQSGKISDSIMRMDKEYFKRLCNILQPKTIICLGRKTFEHVVEALAVGLKSNKSITNAGGYNAYLEQQVGIEVNLDGKISKVFASAHCGTLGINNRGGIHKVEQDWDKISHLI